MANLATYTPDGLLIGGCNTDNLTKVVTVLSGQSLLRGAVVGLATKAVGTATYGTNTGNGTIGSITLSKNAKLGNYVLTCITAAANAGIFQVVDPEGVQLGRATVATAYTSATINFTIADGSTDFVVGDTITIPVATGSGKAKLCDADAVDGSQVPVGILYEDTNATSADTNATIYKTGVFNRNKLTWGANGAPSGFESLLGDVGIFLKDVIYDS